FVAALQRLGVRPSPAALRIARAGTLHSGSATYAFAPGARVCLSVQVRFRSPIGCERAAWDGDPDDFAMRIAPARTFGWLDEHTSLLERGRARGATLDGVLVLLDGGSHPGCKPEAPMEVARHKLLDLTGDLALHGGPPIGSIHAIAPGHAATHAVMSEALA